MAALQVLVDSKVRLDSKNHAGKTPQDLAREAGFTECAIYLTLKCESGGSLERGCAGTF